MDIKDIKSHAFGDTHEIVLNLIKDLKKGTVLDVAAGEGILTYRLQKMGFDVTPADIETKQFKLPFIKPDQVDLNQKLDYKDSSFDYVLCIETIEHISNLGICLSEFKRVLKPGGILILSTPNISTLISRLIFLFSGQFANYFNTRASCIDNNGNDRHIMPLPAWLLVHHLKKTGFVIDRIEFSSGGLEIPTKKRPWKKYVFLPHSGLFGNTVIIKAVKT